MLSKGIVFKDIHKLWQNMSLIQENYKNMVGLTSITFPMLNYFRFLVKMTFKTEDSLTNQLWAKLVVIVKDKFSKNFSRKSWASFIWKKLLWQDTKTKRMQSIFQFITLAVFPLVIWFCYIWVCFPSQQNGGEKVMLCAPTEKLWRGPELNIFPKVMSSKILTFFDLTLFPVKSITSKSIKCEFINGLNNWLSQSLLDLFNSPNPFFKYCFIRL